MARTVLMNITLRAALAECGLALATAGCTVAPSYQPPDPPQARTYTANPVPRTTQAAGGPLGQSLRLIEGEAPAQWWRELESGRLDALVDEALRASPSLTAATAVLTQARESLAAAAGSSQWPQVDLGLGTQRQQTSPSALGLTGETREFGLYNASVGLRYRFDFVGGVDSSLRALAARADIRHHELHGARHVLVANLATAAITRARLAAQLDAQTDILSTQREQLRLAQVRDRLGSAPPEEVSALTAQLELTAAGLPALHQSLRQTEHLLAVLAGRAPDQGVPPFTLAEFRLPERLWVSVPSEWARRRPDIQAAEAALRAAHAELGAAIARRYPQLTLTASLGSQALTPTALFGGTTIWNLLGQLAQPLFNAGLPAEQRAAQATLEAAAANYQRVVLDGLRNVADALRAVEHDAQALAALARAERAADTQHRIVQRQYRAGVASPAQVLVSEQQWKQARAGLIAARAQRLLAIVALYAALAGETSAGPAASAQVLSLRPDKE